MGNMNFFYNVYPQLQWGEIHFNRVFIIDANVVWTLRREPVRGKTQKMTLNQLLHRRDQCLSPNYCLLDWWAILTWGFLPDKEEPGFLFLSFTIYIDDIFHPIPSCYTDLMSHSSGSTPSFPAWHWGCRWFLHLSQLNQYFTRSILKFYKRDSSSTFQLLREWL